MFCPHAALFYLVAHFVLLQCCPCLICVASLSFSVVIAGSKIFNRKYAILQVQAAVEQAMQEANKREQSMHKGLTFENFLRMLRSNSSDSLDQFDDRMSGSGSSHGASAYEQLDNMDKSVRCGDMCLKASTLELIPEVC